MTTHAPGEAQEVPDPANSRRRLPGVNETRDVRPTKRVRRDVAREIIAAVLLVGIVIAAVVFLPPVVAAACISTIAVVYLVRRIVFTWNGALFIFAAVAMFVPIHRFAIPSPFSFQLEPYRLVIVLIVVAMLVALLIDPSFRWRAMRFTPAFGFYLATLLLSIAVNTTSILEQELVTVSLGGVLNLLIIISVLFFVRQLLTTERIVMMLLTFLAWSGGIIAFFAMVEKVTHVNVFLLWNKVSPLVAISDEVVSLRDGGPRSFGSAQHPIALAVLLCMLIPIGIYLSKYGRWPTNMHNRRIVFGLLTLLMLGGIATAISRTAVVVLGVMFLITLFLRPYLALTLAVLAVPLLLVGSLIAPDIVGSTIGSFFDINSLIASQYTSPGWTGAGRLADLDPSFAQVQQNPIFGIGFGTRITVGPDHNAAILDDNVLSTLLEAGAVGVLGLAAFFLYPPIRLLFYAFRTKANPRYAHLAFAIAISAAGYVAAMFFYDAYGFMQTLIVLCMLLAVGIWLLVEAPTTDNESLAPATFAPRRRTP